MTLLVNNKNKLFFDKLDNDTTNLFNSQLLKQYKDRKPGFLESLFGFKLNNDIFYDFSGYDDDIKHYGLNDECKNIIKLAKEYFTKSGINVDEYTGRLTFRKVYYNNSEIKSSEFMPHCDNEELIDTNTCIFYTQKDESLKKGNLCIYTDPSVSFSSFCNFFEEDPKPSVLPIETGSVVVFNGNFFHSPQECGGTGYRNLVLVNLQTKK